MPSATCSGSTAWRSLDRWTLKPSGQQGLTVMFFLHLDLHPLIKKWTRPQNTVLQLILGPQTLVKLLFLSFAKLLKCFRRMLWPKIWKDRIIWLNPQWHKRIGNVFPSSVTAVEQSTHSPQLLERSCSVAWLH